MITRDEVRNFLIGCMSILIVVILVLGIVGILIGLAVVVIAVSQALGIYTELGVGAVVFVLCWILLLGCYLILSQVDR